MKKLPLGNSITFAIKREGRMTLKMTSGKTLTLNNLSYVDEIQKKFTSDSLLNEHGLRIVIEFDKIMLNKRGMFLGKICL